MEGFYRLLPQVPLTEVYSTNPFTPHQFSLTKWSLSYRKIEEQRPRKITKLIPENCKDPYGIKGAESFSILTEEGERLTTTLPPYHSGYFSRHPFFKAYTLKDYHYGPREFFLTQSGVLYARWKNEAEQLGPEKEGSCVHEYKEVSSAGVSKFSTGHFYTLLLTEERELYATGLNAGGELGLNDRKNKGSFQKVPFSQARELLCGPAVSLVITEKGKLFFSGVLTRQVGSPLHRKVFTELVLLCPIKGVQVNWNYLLFLTETGSVYVIGTVDYPLDTSLCFLRHWHKVNLGTQVIQKIWAEGYSLLLLTTKGTVLIEHGGRSSQEREKCPYGFFPLTGLPKIKDALLCPLRSWQYNQQEYCLLFLV